MAFTAPSASKSMLDRVDFGAANSVAQDRKAAFDTDDARPGNRDPSRCKALLRFENGTIFWSSKMAIDADGPAAGPGRLSGSQLDPSNREGQDTTNYRFPEGGPMLAAEVVPYVVLPGGTFRDQTGLAFGDVVMVIFGNKMAGASCPTPDLRCSAIERAPCAAGRNSRAVRNVLCPDLIAVIHCLKTRNRVLFLRYRWHAEYQRNVLA